MRHELYVVHADEPGVIDVLCRHGACNAHDGGFHVRCPSVSVDELAAMQWQHQQQPTESSEVVVVRVDDAAGNVGRFHIMPGEVDDDAPESPRLA